MAGGSVCAVGERRSGPGQGLNGVAWQACSANVGMEVRRGWSRGELEGELEMVGGA